MDSTDVVLEYVYYWVFACWIAHAIAKDKFLRASLIPEHLGLGLWALMQVGGC